jgi:hypothetical protein
VRASSAASQRRRSSALASTLGAITTLTVGCTQPPDPPDALVVDIKRDSAIPLILVNDAVVNPSQRDSVLRSLRGATLDSLLVLPGGTETTAARFGSRGANGVVLIYNTGDR